jgi:hypothetical protein
MLDWRQGNGTVCNPAALSVALVIPVRTSDTDMKAPILLRSLT